MPQRTATIESLPLAFALVKEMQADGLEWGEGYRPLGRQALMEIIQGQMVEAVDCWLDGLDGSAVRDRRNGHYARHLLSELGDLELRVPRTRRFCPTEVLKSSARRGPEIDRTILAGFVLGLSTRKVGEVLLALLGRRVSAATVSRVAKTLDAAVAAFHERPLANRYKALMLDGVVLARRTGAGALRRPVLVALGIRADGQKEIIDFRLAASESAAAWERFLTDLYRRGLTGEGLEVICADGGQGLIAALPTVYPTIPLQRCWAHHPPAALLGTQDQEHPRQGVEGRPRRRQGRPPRHHECLQPTQGDQRRPTLRRCLGGNILQGRRLPAQRPRRPPYLLPLPDRARAQAGENHQRHRTTLPRGPAQDESHGHIQIPNIHGPHPLRNLHPGKQIAGSKHPVLPDT